MQIYLKNKKRPLPAATGNGLQAIIKGEPLTIGGKSIVSEIPFYFNKKGE